MADGAIKRRTVFYIEGYDPRGPQHYHRLYRDEAEKQSRINGLPLKVGARKRIDQLVHSWQVDSGATQTEYRFLRYDDLMRTRWSRTTLAVLGDICRYSWQFLRRGVFLGMLRISWPILITTLMAPGLVALAALLAALAGGLAGLLMAWPLALAVAVVNFVGLVALQPLIEPRFAGFWIGRICAFIADQGSGAVPHMDDRIAAFADRVAEALKAGTADEVLVVGHSVGSHIGVSVCARVLDRIGSGAQSFSFLTLGHTIPLLGLQPQAGAFRNDLQRVADDPRIAWIDVSAAIDGACFPLTDPLWACGLAQSDPARPSPKIVSARFPKLFSPASYARLKRDFSRAHFQYVMAAELPGDYDYFLITAGDKTLAERFAHLESVTGFNRFRMSAR